VFPHHDRRRLIREQLRIERVGRGQRGRHRGRGLFRYVGDDDRRDRQRCGGLHGWDDHRHGERLIGFGVELHHQLFYGDFLRVLFDRARDNQRRIVGELGIDRV
jgi:hypothetical protein